MLRVESPINCINPFINAINYPIDGINVALARLLPEPRIFGTFRQSESALRKSRNKSPGMFSWIYVKRSPRNHIQNHPILCNSLPKCLRIQLCFMVFRTLMRKSNEDHKRNIRTSKDIISEWHLNWIRMVGCRGGSRYFEGVCGVLGIHKIQKFYLFKIPRFHADQTSWKNVSYFLKNIFVSVGLFIFAFCQSNWPPNNIPSKSLK